MKNFDIEKLERKNIYHLPEQTFEKIQAEVFAKITPVKKTPVFKMSWAVGAAASLAAIAGVTWMYSNNDDVQTATYSSINTVPESAEISSQTETYSNVPEISATANEIDEAVTVEQNARFTQVTDQPEIRKSARPVQASRKFVEQEMAEYLDSFTSAEIAEVANNSTQDVYLDLYN